MDVNDLAARLTPRTRLVWLEAAGSVTMEFPDLVALVKLCKARGVLCALDNTWGAGLAFNAFDLTPGQGELGVDLTIHALTKYPSGGGDVLMGSIITRSDDLARVLKLSHMRLGTGVGANDAEMVLRSLSSMPLRYKAQDAAARALALWCTAQPAFSDVLHPALSSAPGHAHWRQLCVTSQAPEGLAAGIFSVVIDPRFPAHAVDTFCDNLKLFKIGYSWGGPMSLVMPYNMTSSRSRSTAHMQRGRVVRFCIGLEQVSDLQEDISQAMAVANLNN
jgi:cystathionine beta-lyase